MAETSNSTSNANMEVAPVSFSSLGFETLTPLLYYSPGDTKVSTSDGDGIRYDLVMVWGWMNAAPRHLLKYIQLHRSLQPGVPIAVVISTTASFFGMTPGSRIPLPLIYNIVKALPETPKIFVHSFSNGGTAGFSEFLAHYRYEVGSPMPMAAMIIDSAPGGTKFPTALIKGINATMEGVRNPILRSIIYPFAYLVFSIIFIPPRVLGLEDPIGRMRRTLNDETLVTEDSVRGYTYCKGDVMVGWEDIEEHANEAEERGWKVSKLTFEGGNHVGCYRFHPEEYEAFVRQIRDGTSVST